MIAKIHWMCWRVILLQPSALLTGIGMPIAFAFLLPAFQGPSFPGILILYMTFAFSSSMDSQSVLRFGLVQLPVGARELVTGAFLYQASLTLVSLLTAYALNLVFALGAEFGDFIRVALLALLFGGISRGLGFRVAGRSAVAVNMLLFIPLLVFGVAGQKLLTLSFLSLPLFLVLTLGGFVLSLALCTYSPPLMKEEAA